MDAKEWVVDFRWQNHLWDESGAHEWPTTLDDGLKIMRLWRQQEIGNNPPVQYRLRNMRTRQIIHV